MKGQANSIFEALRQEARQAFATEPPGPEIRPQLIGSKRIR